MSRPSSWYDDSLPQFSSSIRQLPPAPSTQYHPSSPSFGSVHHPPPPPPSSHHGPPPTSASSSSSTSYQPPLSPYRNDHQRQPQSHHPSSTSTMYAPPQRPQTLYQTHSSGGTAAGDHLDDQLNSLHPQPSPSSAFSLSRSASLGGARRKDPFGNHIDDVERALGSGGDDRGGGGGWSDGGSASHYSNSFTGSFGGGPFGRGAAAGSIGGGAGDLYQGGVAGMMGGGVEGGGHDRSSGLMPAQMLNQGSRTASDGPGQARASFGNHVGSQPPSSNRASGSMGPPPPPQPQPQPPSSTSYQPQQHYSLGQPPPPSQNPYIPQSQQQHHPSSAYEPSANVGGRGQSPGGPPPPPSSSNTTTDWSQSYSPVPSPHVDMRTSPLPRPPTLTQNQSYSSSSKGAGPPPSPSSNSQNQYAHHGSSSSSTASPYQQPNNPYAPQQQHPPPPPQAPPPPSQSQSQSSSATHQASYSTSTGYPSPYAPSYTSLAHSDTLPPASSSSGGAGGYAASPSPTGREGRQASASVAQQLYPSHSREAMMAAGGGADGGPPKAKAGFKKVRDLRDVKPVFAGGRNEGSNPLTALTSLLAQTYSSCNPQFRYEVAHNPRRVLTKPSKGVLNDGHDNEENDYILYVNDWLGTEEGHKYLILDVLGQGTFGQVVKCQNMKTNEVVAVKVIKNKPAYFNQSMMEVAILEELNTKYDPDDRHNILRMRTHFIHCKHLCLVFECLSSNLYELIKQNSFRGLSTQLVKVFTAQLLDTLTVLHEARLIHCDLKPENILLKSLQSPQIKVIDLGSACHEYSTVYTYIQSRFYRSPEVLLGLPYSTAIDMWSLGCIAVELFLGLPLFPGTSEYNQVSRIIEMLGMPPNHLMENGKQVHEFFNKEPSNSEPYGRGGHVFRLKSMEQYSKEHNTTEQPSKQYFKATTLPEIIKGYAFAKKGAKQSDIDKEMAIRASFTDFVLGLLNLDPIKRWSPQQALLHPFITGEKFVGPFDPRRVQSAHQSEAMQQQQHPAPLQAPVDPKRPYGGLVVSTAARTPRAYQDAATYNQQLAQHQTYTAQQQQVQAAASAYRHPFAPSDVEASSAAAYNQQQQQRAYHQQQQQLPPVQQQQQRISGGSASSGLLPSAYPLRNSTGMILPPPAAAHPSNPPSNAYFPTGGRNRANTIGQMDVVPPQLAARLTNLGVEQSAGGRSGQTPVMNRDEMMREWERRNAQGASGKRASVNQTWPQLEFLEGQAETLGWGPSSSSNNARYASSQLQQFPPPPMTVIVDDGQGQPSRSRQLHQHQRDHSMTRDVSMGGVSEGGGNRSSSYDPSPSPNSIPQAPPLAYSGNSNNARYSASYQAPPPTSTAYDAYDPRLDGSLGTLIQPLVPTHGGGGGGGSFSSPREGGFMSNGGGGQQRGVGGHNPFAGPTSANPNSPNSQQSANFGFLQQQQQQQVQKKKSAGVLEGWR